MHNVVPIKGAERPPKVDQSRMETLIITPEMVKQWRLPPFQRPIRINAKVLDAVDYIRKTESIKGVITLGVLKGNSGTLYIVDGQHRVKAFALSEIEAAIADVRVMTFGDLGEMAAEYVSQNSPLVPMKPDDILRGLESTTPSLREIRAACPFVGYDHIRQGGPNSPVVSMSATLRSWNAASFDTPSPHSGGQSATVLSQTIDQASTRNLIAFLSVAHSAWGSERENFRLWGVLNFTLCMWLWVRLVIDRDRFGSKRYVVLDIPQFKRCLLSVAADGDWAAWLTGRLLGERDRSPAYNRLKAIFVRRLSEGLDPTDKKKIMLPQPAWAASR